jgi:PhnB protein
LSRGNPAPDGGEDLPSWDAALSGREPAAQALFGRRQKMLGVNPYIAFKGNCREAIEFYKCALAAEVLFVQTVGESPMSNMGPADNIMHCTIKVGDSTIMMCDDPRPDAAAEGGNISLAIGLNDPERAKGLFRNLAKEGSVLMPLEKTYWAYWAEAFGVLSDKFGVKWMINCDQPK